MDAWRRAASPASPIKRRVSRTVTDVGVAATSLRPLTAPQNEPKTPSLSG